MNPFQSTLFSHHKRDHDYKTNPNNDRERQQQMRVDVERLIRVDYDVIVAVGVERLQQLAARLGNKY